MKNIIKMTASMILVTLSQGLSCSEALQHSISSSSLEQTETVFHDVSSPNNSAKESSSPQVLTIQLPESTPMQKDEGKFQDFFESLITGKKEFNSKEFESSPTPFQKNNRKTLSPRNYFNESPEEFDADIDSIAIVNQNEDNSIIEMTGRFKDHIPFKLKGAMSSHILRSLKIQSPCAEKQEQTDIDEESIMQEIAPIEEISLHEVEDDNLPTSLEKKTAYFTVQNGVIATTALASLATGYIYLRNRK